MDNYCYTVNLGIPHLGLPAWDLPIGIPTWDLPLVIARLGSPAYDSID